MATLEQRMTKGELTTDRVRLSSYLGHEEAARLLPSPERDLGGLTEFDAWLRDAPHFTKEVRVRMAVAAAELVAHLVSEPGASLPAAKAWLECPCREHAEAAYQARSADLDAMRTEIQSKCDLLDPPDPEFVDDENLSQAERAGYYAALAALSAAVRASEPLVYEPKGSKTIASWSRADQAWEAAMMAAAALAYAPDANPSDFYRNYEGEGNTEPVRRAITGELLRWALSTEADLEVPVDASRQQPEVEVDPRDTDLINVDVPGAYGPMNRAELFTEPLDDLLEEHDLGYTDGGGSFMRDGEVLSCDFDVWVYDVHRAFPLILSVLRAAKAPVETELRYEDRTFKLGDFDPDPTRCRGLTKSLAPCRNKPYKENDGYCRVHRSPT